MTPIPTAGRAEAAVEAERGEQQGKQSHADGQGGVGDRFTDPFTAVTTASRGSPAG